MRGKVSQNDKQLDDCSENADEARSAENTKDSSNIYFEVQVMLARWGLAGIIS